MKIFIVAGGYPTKKYNLNGIFEFDQSKALVKADNEVVLLAVDVRSIRRWRKWGYESINKEGVNIEVINIPCGRVPNRILIKVIIFAFNKLYNRVVNKYGEPDIIHSHYISMGYTVSKIFKKSNISLVHTEHYSGMNQKKLKKYYQFLGKNTYCNMDKVIAVSTTLADNIKRNFNIEPIVIPNIVDTSLFKYTPSANYNNSFIFISVGNLLENKRMDLLICSFYEAFKGNSDVKLYIYGEGIERKHLEEIIRRYDLENQVFLKGLVDRKVIAKEMQTSHCFVLVSRTETFGVAYIEALAVGIPVIATKCGGPEGFINERNGILIPVDDIDALTNALTYMYKNNNNYNREFISSFTTRMFCSESVADKLFETYVSIQSR